MQHEADMRDAASAQEQHPHDQAHYPGSAAKVIFTPSSPALGPVNGPAAPPPTPQPLSGNNRVTIHRRSSSLRGSVSSSSVSPESPALNRSASPPQQQQSSLPLTPMIEYLGQDMESEECDSYALAVQTRRFGGQAAYNWTQSAAPMFHPDTSLAPPLPTAPRPTADGRSNPSFLYSPQLSSPSDSASPSPQPLPASHSYTPLQPHLLTSTTRHGYVCIVRNSHFTDPKLPQLIGYEVDEGKMASRQQKKLHERRIICCSRFCLASCCCLQIAC